jgi:glutaminase
MLIASFQAMNDSASRVAFSSPIGEYLARLLRKHGAVREGAVATYIPELAKADPEWFGICIATADGHVYEAGDSRQAFTVQSISKPFVYGLALEDCGRERVLGAIGVEPSGDAFNSISLAPGTGAPLNPMINAGAIAAASLVAGHSPADRFERILATLSLYAGRRLELDEEVYRSERDTGHRNRAIGHMLRNFDVLKEDPEIALDLYFRQCSVRVTCRDLALMGATLANAGVNPLTGEVAVRSGYVESILSVMVTCGMYDYAGEWVYRIGLPAKSGVAGGILAILPGQLGIGVFSPRLDARGNSVRGVKVCEDLSRDMNLHFLSPARVAAAVMRSRRSLATVRSKRRRSAAEAKILDGLGHRVRIYEAQGVLGFAAAEVIARETAAHAGPDVFAILDLKRVAEVDRAASHILFELQRALHAAGTILVYSNAQRLPRFLRFLAEASAQQAGLRLLTFPELDSALDWCESQLLSERPRGENPRTVGLAGQQLCEGLSAEDLAVLERLVTKESFAQGEFVFRMGAPSDRVYFLMSGEVSVVAEMLDGRLRRLSTSTAGMSFGETAMIDGGVRGADVVAETRVECWSLSRSVFEELENSHPALKIGLLRNALRVVSGIAGRLTGEVLALES